MTIAQAGTLVYYIGSKTSLHGPVRVVAVGQCWCCHCNGHARYRLVQSLPACVDGPRPRSITHVRPRSVRQLLPLVD
ncbi:hypothetical protein MXD62_20055 [Frankia sp. Mgl5]|uniref:hypothetical protein n=1 Tax=Frankia sp. Mgl5 TaxID=2933793 RepID=UPI00200EF750|nr:hypothetical protein [Frankia sp. Mgl5]MCK9929445.1 hypothetical protein [Frankia sp. Mgl5]